MNNSAKPHSLSTEQKHSVKFLLNSSSNSFPHLVPASSSSTTTTTTTTTTATTTCSSYSNPSHIQPSSPSSRVVVADDFASSSTRAESESAPFDELLTAAHLLETNNRTRTGLSSFSPLIPISASVMHKSVRGTSAGNEGEGSISCDVSSEPSSVASSVVSGGRVMKRRKKRASVPCDECGRLFGEAAAVRKHKRVVHLKVKDFACDICSRKFAEKSNLKKHLVSVHQQIRAHKCTECSKVFNFTDGLRRHFNNCHLGLRPYNCDMCTSSFKQRTHLQKHKQSVHNIKPTPRSSVFCNSAMSAPTGDTSARSTAATVNCSTSVASSSE